MSSEPGAWIAVTSACRGTSRPLGDSAEKPNSRSRRDDVVDDGTVSLWGHVRVDKEGVSWDPDVENRPVRFNLLVERVYWGVLPARTVRLIGFLGVALGLTLGCGVPRARRVLFRELTARRRNAD